MSIEAKAAKIRLVLFDVDGVLTDGKVVIHADATESKTFDIKDGIAMVWGQRAGLTVGLLSARQSATMSSVTFGSSRQIRANSASSATPSVVASLRRPPCTGPSIAAAAKPWCRTSRRANARM